MNLLCLLFGIDCRAPQITRASSRPVTSNPEFDRLPANVKTMLKELDKVDIDTLTPDQLQQVLDALHNNHAASAEQRLKEFTGGRSPGTIV